jgi:hypothetical protein
MKIKPWEKSRVECGLKFQAVRLHTFCYKVFISPNDFRVDLPNNTNAYFATCEAGLDKQAIADSLGLPISNVHFNSGLSWANNSYNFISDVVYNNVNPGDAFRTYLDANKDYQDNPAHRTNWMTERNEGTSCTR